MPIVNFIIGLLHQSSVQETALPVLAIGDLVWVDTLCYGAQVGKVEAIVENPYYGEVGMAAYVVGNGWTEYLAVDVEVQS